MQEEIEHKTVNLAISTTKLSARTLLRGMQFLLRQYDKHASQGKQSMKRLVRQNRGVTNSGSGSCRSQRDGAQCARHPGTARRSAAAVRHHYPDPGCAVRSRCYL